MSLLHRRVAVRDQVQARSGREETVRRELRHDVDIRRRQERGVRLQPGEQSRRQDTGLCAHHNRNRVGDVRARTSS